MRKIRLELEELSVESFDTAAGDESPRGTVRGHSTDTQETACGPDGSNPFTSCYSDAPDCQTLWGWSGCDFSCEFAC